MLIEDGRLCKRALAKELLTHAELLTVLHRQGFARIADVERCILEPGGGFFIKPKEPPREERHHQELMARIDELSRQIAALKN